MPGILFVVDGFEGLLALLSFGFDGLLALLSVGFDLRCTLHARKKLVQACMRFSFCSPLHAIHHIASLQASKVVLELVQTLSSGV